MRFLGLTKFLSFFIGAILIMGELELGWSIERRLGAFVDIKAPQALDLKLVPWADNCSIKQRVINFGVGSNYQTSWEDKVSSGWTDGWVSADENVGFSIIAVGPAITKKLTIRCGKLKKTDGSEEIPYQSPDKQIDYFGFTAIVIPDVNYIAGSSDKMQPHSKEGWIYEFSSWGKEISVYNMLRIPPNLPPGEYCTSGSGDYNHYIITLM